MRIDIDTLTEAELQDLNNRKPVTVMTDERERWNVAPVVLRRADGSVETDPSVIPIRSARSR